MESSYSELFDQYLEKRKSLQVDGDFKEEEHPRGQPKNKGQFVKKGTGSAPVSAKKEEKKSAPASHEKVMGVNINDDIQPFTQQILSGKKTIETRKTNSLHPYIGKRIGIVRTSKKGKAMLVGYATVSKEKEYNSKEEFDKDYNKHLIDKDSPYYIQEKKYGYELTDVKKTDPIPVDSKGIVARQIPEETPTVKEQTQSYSVEFKGLNLLDKSKVNLINKMKMAENQVRDMLTFEGYKTVARYDFPKSQRGVVYIIANAKTDKGDLIETTFSVDEDRPDDIHLNYLEVSGKGHGIAKDYLKRIEAYARATGKKTLSLDADISIGRYAWAKLGFEPTDPDYLRDMKRHMLPYVKKVLSLNGQKDYSKEIAQIEKDIAGFKKVEDVCDYHFPDTDFTHEQLKKIGYMNDDVPDDLKMHLGKSYMTHQKLRKFTGYTGVKTIGKTGDSMGAFQQGELETRDTESKSILIVSDPDHGVKEGQSDYEFHKDMMEDSPSEDSGNDVQSIFDRFLARRTTDAQVHAPKGGVSVKGKHFKGGEFIPKEGGYQEAYKEQKKEKPAEKEKEPAEEKKETAPAKGKDVEEAYAKIKEAYRETVQLKNMDLRGIDFVRPEMRGRDNSTNFNFSGSDLSGVDFKGLYFNPDDDFSGCNLTGANFGKGNLLGVNFEGANITDINIVGAYNLHAANWKDVKYSHLSPENEALINNAKFETEIFYPDKGTEKEKTENEFFDQAKINKQNAQRALYKKTKIKPILIKDCISQWAASSGDHEFYSILIQKLVQDVFDLKDASLEHFDKVLLRDVIKEIKSPDDEDAEQYKELVKAQYELTQEWFADHGYKPDDKILLFRGLKSGKELERKIEAESLEEKKAIESIQSKSASAKEQFVAIGFLKAKGYSEQEIRWLAHSNIPSDEGSTRLQPLSSFSSDIERARSFAEGDSSGKEIIFASLIPVKEIYSHPQTGFGCTEEREFVVLGGVKKYTRVNSNEDLAKVFKGSKTHDAEDTPINIDALLENADWTKQSWDLPKFNSPEFNEWLKRSGMTMEHFKTLPVYQNMIKSSKKNIDAVFDSFLAKRKTMDAQVHAPKGGVTVKGKKFRGGEFIPSEGGYAEAYKKQVSEKKTESPAVEIKTTGKEEPKGQIAVPPKLTSNFDMKGDLSNVKNWKAKVMIRNSAREDDPKIGEFGKVRYIMFSNKSDLIVPIAIPDEHQIGYELMGEYQRKGLLPKEETHFTSVCATSTDFFYAETKKSKLAAYKKFLAMGGDPNLRVQAGSGSGTYLGTVKDFVDKNGEVEFEEKGQLKVLGKNLISKLEDFTNTYNQLGANKNPIAKEKIGERLVRMASSLITTVHDDSYHLGEYGEVNPLTVDTTKKWKQELSEASANKDYQKVSEIILGMDGLKNRVHSVLKMRMKKKGYDTLQYKAYFGDLNLALREFERLGSLSGNKSQDAINNWIRTSPLNLESDDGKYKIEMEPRGGGSYLYWLRYNGRTKMFSTLEEAKTSAMSESKRTTDAIFDSFLERRGAKVADAVVHAPKGGVTVKGKKFIGGQFIPKEGGYQQAYLAQQGGKVQAQQQSKEQIAQAQQQSKKQIGKAKKVSKKQIAQAQAKSGIENKPFQKESVKSVLKNKELIRLLEERDKRRGVQSIGQAENPYKEPKTAKGIQEIDVTKYPEKAEEITPEMREAQAEYGDIIARASKNINEIRTGTAKITQVSGKLTGNKATTIKTNAENELNTYTNYLATDTALRVRDFIDNYKRSLERGMSDGSLKDVDAGMLNSLSIDCIQKIIHQEVESNRQQFTDHGVRHIVGDMKRSQAIAKILNPKITGREALLLNFIVVNHDIGYTTPLIREGGVRGVGVSKDHPKFSQKITGQQEHLWDQGKIFSKKEFDQALEIIGTHDDTKLDKADVLGTSMRLADNLSLFSNEKLPSAFKYVKGGDKILIDMGIASKNNDTQSFDKLKADLHKKIETSRLNENLKRDLKSATNEISYLTPKYTMGVLAGGIDQIKGVEGKVNITVKYDRYDKFLQKIFDMGQRQTKKLLEDYGIKDFDKSSYDLGDFVKLNIVGAKTTDSVNPQNIFDRFLEDRKTLQQDGEFKEEEHPRGQPKNKGQFVKKGSEASGGEEKTESKKEVSETKFTPPKKVRKAYKLFRTLKGHPNKLFPLFIGKSTPTPIGEWIPAEFLPTKGFAPRGGWHVGALPRADHLLNKQGEIPKDRVWAEVEIPDDVEWQTEADKYKRLGIQYGVPVGGHYRFPRPANQGGEWMIAGALKVNKILTPQEVEEINAKAGLPTKSEVKTSKPSEEKKEESPKEESSIITPLVKEAVNQLMPKVVNRKDAHEILMIYDKSGTPMNIEGGEGYVIIDDKDAEKIEYTLHNHPSSASFSNVDVTSLIRWKNWKRSDVVAKDGTFYSLEKDEFWNSFKGNLTNAAKKINRLWFDTLHFTMLSFKSRIDKGENADAVWKEHTNLIMERVAAKAHLKYTRILNAFDPKQFATTTDSEGEEEMPEKKKGMTTIIDDRNIMHPPYDEDFDPSQVPTEEPKIDLEEENNEEVFDSYLEKRKTKDTLETTSYQGLPVVIENPVGSIRKHKNGITKMFYPYGYIKKTVGRDGDEIDCFIGNDPYAANVFVIKIGIDDREDKVMLGFSNETQARDAFLAHYDDQKALGEITEMPIKLFREVLENKGKKGINLTVDALSTEVKSRIARMKEMVSTFPSLTKIDDSKNPPPDNNDLDYKDFIIKTDATTGEFDIYSIGGAIITHAKTLEIAKQYIDNVAIEVKQNG